MRCPASIQLYRHQIITSPIHLHPRYHAMVFLLLILYITSPHPPPFFSLQVDYLTSSSIILTLMLIPILTLSLHLIPPSHPYISSLHLIPPSQSESSSHPQSIQPTPHSQRTKHLTYHPHLPPTQQAYFLPPSSHGIQEPAPSQHHHPPTYHTISTPPQQQRRRA